jgi:hypothetical protein
MNREPGYPAQPVHPDPANPMENPRPEQVPLDVPFDPDAVPLGGPEHTPVPPTPGPPPPHPLGPPEPQS